MRYSKVTAGVTNMMQRSQCLYSLDIIRAEVLINLLVLILCLNVFSPGSGNVLC